MPFRTSVSSSCETTNTVWTPGRVLAFVLTASLGVVTPSNHAESFAASSLKAKPDAPQLLEGRDAFGDWKTDRPGVRRKFTLADQPAVSPDKMNQSEVVPMTPGMTPQVPPGFRAELVASGLAQPRVIRTAPNGDLFVANSKANEIRVYRFSGSDAKPTSDEVFATGLKKPYGIAFYPPGPTPEWVYVANTDSVVRFKYALGDLKASVPAPEVIIDRLPTTHHWTRDIAFSADGTRLFLAIGSGSNAALDMFPEPRDAGGLEAWKRTKALGAPWDTEERRAMICSTDPMGKGEKVHATGLRNPAGITIQPATGRVWAVVNERDGLGDNTPFEYATYVREGGFYGWPWFYPGPVQDPRHLGARPDLKEAVNVPDVLMQPHSAPLQIAFYNGTSFPAEYKGDAFVTFHGSWSRENRTGYKVVRLRFDPSGQATGEYEDFVTGFVVSDRLVWGRPVGVTVGTDGSLFITEDGSGTIWRISYDPSASP